MLERTQAAQGLPLSHLIFRFLQLSHTRVSLWRFRGCDLCGIMEGAGYVIMRDCGLWMVPLRSFFSEALAVGLGVPVRQRQRATVFRGARSDFHGNLCYFGTAPCATGPADVSKPGIFRVRFQCKVPQKDSSGAMFVLLNSTLREHKHSQEVLFWRVLGGGRKDSESVARLSLQ